MNQRTVRELARATIVAGLAGGVAMVPIGLLVRASGKDVNVYGELTAQLFFASTSPLALLAVHVVVSLSLAAPLAFLATRVHVASWALGLAWAIAAWLLLNLWLLPLFFSRPSAWAEGWLALWPGFVVHAVYGLAAGGALRWVASPRLADGSPLSAVHPTKK